MARRLSGGAGGATMADHPGARIPHGHAYNAHPKEPAATYQPGRRVPADSAALVPAARVGHWLQAPPLGAVLLSRGARDPCPLERARMLLPAVAPR